MKNNDIGMPLATIDLDEEEGKEMDGIGELFTQEPVHSDMGARTGDGIMEVKKKKKKSKKRDEKIHEDHIKVSKGPKIKKLEKPDPFGSHTDDDVLNQLAISATRPPDIESYAR